MDDDLSGAEIYIHKIGILYQGCEKHFPWYSERSLSRILSELATNQNCYVMDGAGRRYQLL